MGADHDVDGLGSDQIVETVENVESVESEKRFWQDRLDLLDGNEQKSEVGDRRSEARGQRSEIRSQKRPDDRGQNSEASGRTDVRGQKSKVSPERPSKRKKSKRLGLTPRPIPR